jgi:hypothetical protein
MATLRGELLCKFVCILNAHTLQLFTCLGPKWVRFNVTATLPNDPSIGDPLSMREGCAPEEV